MTDKQSTSRYLISGSVWSVVGQVLSVFGSLLHISLLSRLLSAELMGSYLLIHSVVMFVSIFGMYGLPETMMRESARLLEGSRKADSSAGKVIARTYLLVFILSLGCLVAIVASPGVFLFYTVFDIEYSVNLLWLCGLWLLLHCIHYTTIYVYRGLHDVVRATIYGVSLRSLLTALVLMIYYFLDVPFSLEDAILVNVGVMCVALVVSAFPLRYVWGLRGTKWALNSSDVLRQAAPLCFNAAFQEVFLRSGFWMLGFFVAKGEVALFGAALQLIVIIVIPVRIINGVLPPVIANYYFNKEDKSRLEIIVRSLATACSGLTILVVLTIIFFGDYLLSVIYGGFYADAYPVLVLLSLGHASTVLLGPTRAMLKMTNNQSSLFKINLGFGCFSVLVVACCAFLSGSVAVAAGTSFVLITTNVYLLISTHRLTEIWPSSFFRLNDLKSVMSVSAGLVKKKL